MRGKKNAMLRPFAVESETRFGSPYFHDSGAARMVGERLNRKAGRRGKCTVGRLDRVRCECREEVGKEQLLMLLLMVDTKFNQFERCFGKRGQCFFQRLVDLCPIGLYFAKGGAAQHAATGTGVSRTFRFIITVEEECEALVECPV